MSSPRKLAQESLEYHLGELSPSKQASIIKLAKKVGGSIAQTITLTSEESAEIGDAMQGYSIAEARFFDSEIARFAPGYLSVTLQAYVRELSKNVEEHVDNNSLDAQEVDELKTTIKNLPDNERSLLESIIHESSLLMNDLQIITPCLERSVRLASIALAVGVAEGAAQYHLTSNPYSSVAGGIATTAFTLFGHATLSMSQTRKMYELRNQRADDIFNRVSDQENKLSL